MSCRVPIPPHRRGSCRRSQAERSTILPLVAGRCVHSRPDLVARVPVGEPLQRVLNQRHEDFQSACHPPRSTSHTARIPRVYRHACGQRSSRSHIRNTILGTTQAAESTGLSTGSEISVGDALAPPSPALPWFGTPRLQMRWIQRSPPRPPSRALSALCVSFGLPHLCAPDWNRTSTRLLSTVPKTVASSISATSAYVLKIVRPTGFEPAQAFAH